MYHGYIYSEILELSIAMHNCIVASKWQKPTKKYKNKIMDHDCINPEIMVLSITMHRCFVAS